MTDSDRTIVLLEEGERGSLRLKLLASPNHSVGKPFAFKPTGPAQRRFDELTDPTEVERYGEALLAALAKRRNTLGEALADVLRAPAGQIRPLCFKVEGSRAEELSLCWEALWERRAKFLALSPQWPIGRIVDTGSYPTRVFEAPLRILAVLSAIGVEAEPEWLALEQAVTDARRLGLDVQVTAVVGEQRLFDALSGKAAQQSWLEVVALEGEWTLRSLLNGPWPHILHFFCHGSVGYGEGRLEFATIGDWAEAEEFRQDSVNVRLDELRTLVASREPWLVTLNCCSGARPLEDAHSMAQAMVEAGAGAAIGWRQAVDATDANRLCRALYQGVLADLAQRLTNQRLGAKVTVELAAPTYAARADLLSAHDGKETYRNWTLPVLYVARDPLQVVIATAPPTNRAEPASPARPAAPAGPAAAVEPDGDVVPEGGGVHLYSTSAELLQRAHSHLLDAQAPPDFIAALLGSIESLTSRMRTEAKE